MLRFNCFCFILFSCFGHAQQNDLLKIINTETSIEKRQQKIDSFFGVNEKKLPPRILADCYHDVANKWYHEQWWANGSADDIDKAVYYTKKALEIKLTLKNLEEGSLEQSAFNLGAFYELKGDVFSAIDYYLFLIDRGRDKTMIQDAKLEIGRLYVEIGDFYKALNLFEQVIVFYDALNSRELGTINLIDAHIFTAETYSLLGIKHFSSRIRSNLRKADSLLQNSPVDHPYFRNRANQAEGNRLLELGEYDKAIGFHKKVLADSANLYPVELARVHNSIAFSQLKIEHLDQAHKHLRQAIANDESYSSPYENLGDLSLVKNDYREALADYQQAINLVIDKEIPFEQVPSIQEMELSTEKVALLGHMIAKANGWLRYYEHDNNKDHLNQALKTFSLADQLVDIIRSESTEYQSKLFWREKGASLYTKAVAVCYLLDKPEEAYYFMERNKAVLLLEDISEERAKEIANLPDAMAQREFELKQAIYLSENELKNFESSASDSLETTKRRVFRNKRVYNTFMDSLTKVFPDYAQIKKKVHVLPYQSFSTKYTTEDEVVLHYILNDDQGYGLLTTGDETEFFKLDDVQSLNKKIISLYRQLTDLATSRSKMTAYNRLSHQVFKQLLPEAVYTKIKNKKLTVVTDFILQQIPFEAFTVNEDQGTYLIEDTEIRYAYSMSYLDAKKHVNGHAEKELFGLAPVQFASLGLPDLMFSSSEVKEAEKIYPGVTALHGEATKAEFLRNVNDTKILHLSTHADVGEGGNPWIAFSDTKMFLNEIYATKNQAEMVILSACNTSIGELKKGEGAMSLARGFFHSGAKSVVSSLWSTNDKSSKELMVAFYKGLDEGLTKSAAMRKAKVDYINTYRGTTISPAYWGALIIIGDNAPISSGNFLSSYWVWAILGVLMLSVLYFINKKKKAIS